MDFVLKRAREYPMRACTPHQEHRLDSGRKGGGTRRKSTRHSRSKASMGAFDRIAPDSCGTAERGAQNASEKRNGHRMEKITSDEA